MISAILAAAALNAQPAPTPCVPDLQAAPWSQQPRPCSQPKPILMANPPAPVESDVGINLYRQPRGCGPVGREITRRIETSAPAKRMAATLAVIREVDGCGVPTPINYHPDYLLPGAADPQSAKPVDGPPRRR